MDTKVYYWLNGNNKLVPVVDGDRPCGRQIEKSNFHQLETNCKNFIQQIQYKIQSGLRFCNGFNLNNLIDYCNRGEIYYV